MNGESYIVYEENVQSDSDGSHLGDEEYEAYEDEESKENNKHQKVDR